jgi:hypothetical protein
MIQLQYNITVAVLQCQHFISSQSFVQHTNINNVVTKLHKNWEPQHFWGVSFFAIIKIVTANSPYFENVSSLRCRIKLNRHLINLLVHRYRSRTLPKRISEMLCLRCQLLQRVVIDGKTSDKNELHSHSRTEIVLLN